MTHFSDLVGHGGVLNGSRRRSSEGRMPTLCAERKPDPTLISC